MAPKSRVKRKTTEAGRLSANVRKKQRVSSESAEGTPVSIETMPNPTPSSLEETPAIDVPSEVGPSSSVVGASVAGRSTSGADPRARVEETSTAVITVSLERVSASDDATAGVSGMEGVMAADSESSSRATSQDILGKFVEDWLETLDKEEIKSVSLFI